MAYTSSAHTLTYTLAFFNIDTCIPPSQAVHAQPCPAFLIPMICPTCELSEPKRSPEAAAGGRRGREASLERLVRAVANQRAAGSQRHRPCPPSIDHPGPKRTSRAERKLSSHVRDARSAARTTRLTGPRGRDRAPPWVPWSRWFGNSWRIVALNAGSVSSCLHLM